MMKDQSYGMRVSQAMAGELVGAADGVFDVVKYPLIIGIGAAEGSGAIPKEFADILRARTHEVLTANNLMTEDAQRFADFVRENESEAVKIGDLLASAATGAALGAKAMKTIEGLKYEFPVLGAIFGASMSESAEYIIDEGEDQRQQNDFEAGFYAARPPLGY